MAAISPQAPALAAALALAAAPAHAAQLCGWLTETLQPNQVHEFSLWLESDGDLDVLYKMTGQGVVTASGKSYSPSSGSYSLHAKRPEQPWRFGTNIVEGDVDIVAEVHVMPKSVFSDEPTPLLGAFTFRRHVPETEKKPPGDFAKHQCVSLAAQP